MNQELEHQIQSFLDERGADLFYKRLSPFTLDKLSFSMYFFSTNTGFPFTLEASERRYYVLGFRKYMTHLTTENAKSILPWLCSKAPGVIFKQDRLTALYEDKPEPIALEKECIFGLIQECVDFTLLKFEYLIDGSPSTLEKWISSYMTWFENYQSLISIHAYSLLLEHTTHAGVIEIQARIYRERQYTFFQNMGKRAKDFTYLLSEPDFNTYKQHLLHSLHQRMIDTPNLSSRDVLVFDVDLRSIKTMSFYEI